MILLSYKVSACRDVLCTDKTGTLTMDEVHLFKALDIAGCESLDILRLAYAKSRFQARLWHASMPSCVASSHFCV